MKKLPILVGVLCAMFFISSQAADLWQVYQQAKLSDPTYQHAKATWLAARQKLPQSTAVLLPQIALQGDYISSYNNAKSGIATGKYTTNSRDYELTVTQPIINFAAFAGRREAYFSVKQAAAVFAKAKQDLIINTAKDYFAVLLAKDTLRFTRAELRATAKQLDQAKQRYKVGLVAITNVYQTQASYDSIVASLISAKSNLKNSREALRQLTGVYYKQLAPLKHNIPLVKPNPANIDTWVNTAIHNNMDIMASHFAVAAARENVSVKFAGHLPTLNAIGSLTHSITDPNLTSVDTADNISRSIDLQVKLPLFNGGLVVAQTREAHFQYQATIDTFEATYRQTISQTRQNYNNIVAGLSKIRADRQSIISHEASLRSTEAAYRVGTNTIIDVLDTQKDLYQAQQQHADDQYQYINDTLALKENAGSLKSQDLYAINRWLRTAKRYPRRRHKHEHHGGHRHHHHNKHHKHSRKHKHLYHHKHHSPS